MLTFKCLRLCVQIINQSLHAAGLWCCQVVEMIWNLRDVVVRLMMERAMGEMSLHR